MGNERLKKQGSSAFHQLTHRKDLVDKADEMYQLKNNEVALLNTSSPRLHQ